MEQGGGAKMEQGEAKESEIGSVGTYVYTRAAARQAEGGGGGVGPRAGALFDCLPTFGTRRIAQARRCKLLKRLGFSRESSINGIAYAQIA